MRYPAGYFLLKPGTPSRDIADSLLKHPLVVGQTIRVPWSVLNPKAGKFDFDEFDQGLAQCKRLGKVAKLLVQTGRDGLSPTWIKGPWLASGSQRAPAPWSPEMMAAYQSLVQAIGARYRPNTAIVGVHPTGPTWPSAEMHPMPGLKQQRGYSATLMRAAWAESIRAWDMAFPDVAQCLAISVMKEADSYVRDVISNARAVIGDRLSIQHNALKAVIPTGAPHHRLVSESWMKGIRVGFEMVKPVSDPVVGSRNIMDSIKVGRHAGGSYFDIYPQPDDVKGLK